MLPVLDTSTATRRERLHHARAFLDWRARPYSVERQRRALITSLGQRPRNRKSQNTSAESAIHFRGEFSALLPPCPNHSVKLFCTSSLARRIASLGSLQVCDYACMRISQQ